MKKRLSTTFVILALGLSACNESGHQSAVIIPPAQAVRPFLPMPETVVREIPISRGRPRGSARSSSSHSSTTSDSSSSSSSTRSSADTTRRNRTDNNASILAGRGGSSEPATPSNPQGSGTPDARDAKRRLEADGCDSIRALATKWKFEVNVDWKALKDSQDNRARKLLEAGAAPFFIDTVCEGLKRLKVVNEKIALAIEKQIGDRKLDVKITDNDDIGSFKKNHFWRTVFTLGFSRGTPEIKLGRRVLEGLVASVANETNNPGLPLELALSDNLLLKEPRANHPEVLSNQIQLAKGAFFHTVLHFAGVEVIDKGKHTDESFKDSRKELDVIHACTAQVYPSFYIRVRAEDLDRDGHTTIGPFYQNSPIACLTCATADAHPNGVVFATMKFATQPILEEKRQKADCGKFEKLDPVPADRSGFLYEGLN